ncbi:MAG: glycosyltransferase [Betaproteobacteria bacterium]|nr:glycosyltransferase [Betaproteobacteria bacterium]NDD11097.1 glycosyltransferase [Betaproteobacteria bacterium]
MKAALQVRTEAWLRGSHSFALVYRFQMQELLKDAALNIHHREQEHLHPGQHDGVDPDFSLGTLEQVSAMLASEARPPDVVYRLVSPSDLSIAAGERLVSYLVTELGLGITRFAEGGADIRRFEDHGGVIHTPTRWSKQRLIHGGFSAEHVAVIPNGVNPSIYYPLAPEEVLSIRTHQGFSPDDVVLLNVGSPVWNKGLDVLVSCFARVRAYRPNLYLILKDQSSVYGVGVKTYVEQTLRTLPGDVQAKALAGIRIIPSFLSFKAMRAAMNAADFYVSPYRAEGFNMPVLEAIACGTRPIVSAMGSTSDFCHHDNAFLVDGKLHGPMTIQGRTTDAHFEPHPGALEALLEAAASSDPGKRKLPGFEREKAVEQFNWGVAARALRALFLEMGGH